MKADPLGVLTGAHYLDGDFAAGEGAMAAGCRFVAGYPITPSTEVVERMSRRFPMMGGTFIQMEDEMASMAAVVAAGRGSKNAAMASKFSRNERLSRLVVPMAAKSSSTRTTF